MNRTSPARRRMVGLALTAGVLVSGCGTEAGSPRVEGSVNTSPTPSLSPGTETGGPVRIATGVNQQTRVVAHMYAQQLAEERIAAEVVDVGTQRASLIAALRADEVDVVPDFTGDLFVHVRENQASATPSAEPSPTPVPTRTGGVDLLGSLAQLLDVTGDAGPTGDDVYRALPDALPSDLRVLDQSPGETTDRLVVTPATAVEHQLRDLSTVGERCPKLTVGMPHKYVDTAQGVTGLKAYYDCVPKATKEYASHDQRVDALLNNEVQAAVLPASSPVIGDNGLTVLDDPHNLYRPEHVVPLTSPNLTDGAVTTINGVTDGIATDDLTAMTRLTGGNPAAMTAEEAATFVREQPR